MIGYSLNQENNCYFLLKNQTFLVPKQTNANWYLTWQKHEENFQPVTVLYLKTKIRSKGYTKRGKRKGEEPDGRSCGKRREESSDLCLP